MKEYFTIGETARLNNISIQTLRYYDRIGIFKPYYTDQDNGYRYYHVKQFFYLDIIKYLKYMKTPLEEIKRFTSSTCTPEHMQQFLEKQESVIVQEMEKLERARQLLHRRRNQLNEQLDICSKKDEGFVYFRYIDEQTILKVETPQVNPHNQSDLYYRKLADVLEKIGDVVDNYYGFIYDFKPYKDSRDIYCNSIYTAVCKEKKIDIVEKNIRLDTIPSGEYVCIAFDWSAKNYDEYYQKLYQYIESHGIQTEGKVYQVSLPIDFNSLREENFLTELRVLKK
ncbi:MerR family DNA-binding transcriptional regulator [Bacillus inaquosorum]|uniref:BmrR protein n=1 Tax=Bacillus inaquosorum KCTC 13429 TaxID=1236548 RepID=A0A9W5LJY3_9BACI|nr:MerR family DNA-binding transcriptional regulator [Bacillus inaquosorum]AWM17750.1 MerR family DNA-binding transcriptional regulator [Bacillus inaquosorum]ELS62109.1 BmrR protein [Bacillus inaquosorum KCTC 13429]MCY7976631.1 MerR family transcriptional regulator [Bacillus inaquosorum]MCY8139078.1 MerR family transcriptional regulator [Bacillus inaquosorum]MCY8239547.1 MerR family transcriptional regulator [Bacillus inaquosorum]